MTFCFKFQCGGGRKVWTKILCSPCFVRGDVKPENLPEWLKASLCECCQEFLFIRTCAASTLSAAALWGRCFKGTHRCQPSRAQQSPAEFLRARSELSWLLSGHTCPNPGHPTACFLGALQVTKGQGSGRASLKSVECLNTGAQASFHSLSFGNGVPFLSSGLRQ